MFFRTINNETQLSLTIPQYAEELFELTDQNREFLSQWLPWLHTIETPSDTKNFIELQLKKYQRGEALHASILHQGKIAGVLGFNHIDRNNHLAHVGYWLGKKYNGKGIMTESVKDLVNLGFEYYSLNKIEIHCGAANQRSRLIPQRLGFRQEGVIRQVEKLNYGYQDQLFYGLLKSEWSG